MMKRKELAVTLAGATTVEAAIETLVVPDGHQYNVKEYNFIVPADTQIFGYIVDEKVVEATPAGQVDKDRLVTGWELKTGDEFRVTGINTAVGAQYCGIMLHYDDVLV